MFTLSVPLPGIEGPTVKELKRWLAGYEQASKEGPVRGGVVVEGDAAAYALVWEWGNARQTKEGPKTVRGINPDGEEVWLSIQAPFGYIRIHEPDFIRILEQKLGTVDFSRAVTAQQILDEIKRVSVEGGEEIAELLREVAPKDKGDLREGIQVADPDDKDLAITEEDIELGQASFGHVVRGMLKKLKG